MLTALALLAALPTPARGQDREIFARGEAVVDQWCRMCHPREGAPLQPDMAPTFEEIARRPGRDRAFFARFLREDHFPMPIYRLFESEKADVAAYLAFLGRQAR